MARNNAPKIELTAYDDLFQADESRAEAKLSKIRDIPISQIDEFPDHPFKVLMDEDMQQLVESIKRNGVMTPAIRTSKSAIRSSSCWSNGSAGGNGTGTVADSNRKCVRSTTFAQWKERHRQGTMALSVPDCPV